MTIRMPLSGMLLQATRAYLDKLQPEKLVGLPVAQIQFPSPAFCFWLAGRYVPYSNCARFLPTHSAFSEGVRTSFNGEPSICKYHLPVTGGS
ncbi:Hypothetical predicted protein [Podarcis lilfordi]|uniref:Uncharacterized protein n=1 Tax=Podarcis lilfordi TaxID=74358 RepID=A0AA35KFI6_9SAUR|nr:Hypothetical predicted protein [Podarcis lilfordi]